MPTEVICPDCGGVLGAIKPTPDGRKPCSCIRIMPFNPSADTVDEIPGATDVGKAKVCCNCGKDLTGHRRFKDSEGYWCKDCHRIDKARKTAAETRCPDCGHMKPINSMVRHDDRLICPACHKLLVVQEKREHNQRVFTAAHSAHERAHLLIWVVIAAALLLIILLRYFKVI